MVLIQWILIGFEAILEIKLCYWCALTSAYDHIIAQLHKQIREGLNHEIEAKNVGNLFVVQWI